ncbi:MAG: type II secretion system protein [Acidobacteria bacterium]|nr:type II secretion system protein [Acidobacteriota bacterium]
MQPGRFERGFTLLEVVVALAIVGVGITLALQLFSGALKNVRKIDLAAEAMNHAENVMNEILSDENIRSARAMHDDIDENFRWEAVIDEFEVPEQSRWEAQQPFPLKLLNVRVDVVYKNDKYGKLYRLSCLKPVGLRDAGKPPQVAPVNPFQAIQ